MIELPFGQKRNVPVLATQGLTRCFGGLVAVDRVDFALYPGEVRCLIGPNGAGKTTFFHLISGVLKSTSGEILYNGRSIVHLQAHEICRLGIARTFQIPNLFNGLTVLENVRLAASRPYESFHPFRSIASRSKVDDQAENVLQIVGLLEKSQALAGRLSHGEKKRLELAVALACQPRVLLLDEPTAGMTVAETKEMSALIARLGKELTLLVVEHDIEFVREIASRVTVFHRGSVLADGMLSEIENDPRVREIYLGQGLGEC